MKFGQAGRFQAGHPRPRGITDEHHRSVADALGQPSLATAVQQVGQNISHSARDQERRQRLLLRAAADICA